MPAHQADPVGKASRTTIRLPGTGASFEQLTKPTPTQARALELIDRYRLKPQSSPIQQGHPANPAGEPNRVARPGELRSRASASPREAK